MYLADGLFIKLYGGSHGMNKEEMANYLRGQIELYHTNALNEDYRDVYRIRCYGMARGFQMSLAMLTGEIADIKPIKVKGELIR